MNTFTISLDTIKRFIPLCVLICCLLFVSRSFIRGGLFRAHDSEFHGARVMNYYLALKQGQFPPRWAPNLNAGLGYPTFLFIYPLPYAIPTVLYALGFSIEWSINLFVVLCIWAGTIGMYVLSSYITRKQHQSSIASIAAALYLFAPYSLVNIFVRNAIGEVAFFGILPWVVLLFSFKDQKKPFYGVLTSIALTIMILSHQLSSMIAIPLLLGYSAIIHQFHWKRVIQQLLFIGVSFAIAAWFWVPFLAEKEWTIISKNSSVIAYWKEFPTVLEMLWSKWAYGGFTPGVMNESFSKMIGPAYLFIAIESVLVYVTKKRWSDRYLLFWTAVFWISLFFVSPFSKLFWDQVKPLQYLQFPWRLLWISTFASCMIFISIFQHATSKIMKTVLITPILLSCGYFFLFCAKPVATFKNTNEFWVQYPFTATAYNENLPIWADRSTPNQVSESVLIRKKGELLFSKVDAKQQTIGSTQLLYWTGSHMKYVVTVPEEGEVIQKTLYFPGWKVWIDGKLADIQYEDDEFPGRILFSVDAGTHTIEVRFTEDTFARKVGNSISMFAIALLCGFALYTGIRINKQRDAHA